LYSGFKSVRLPEFAGAVLLLVCPFVRL